MGTSVPGFGDNYSIVENHILVVTPPTATTLLQTKKVMPGTKLNTVAFNLFDREMRNSQPTHHHRWSVVSYEDAR